MKSKIWLYSTIIATSSMLSVAHADNSTRVAATSALGSVVGTAIGQQLGGNTGAMIGSAIGGAGGAMRQVINAIELKLLLVED